MKFKNMVSTMLALLLTMTTFSCNKQEVKTKPDFPELNKETVEIKNDIKIEKFFDVSDCSPMLESTVPIASDENHIFFTNPGSDEYMYSEDADKELSIYKADIGKTEMVFDELSEIIPGNAENIVRNENFLIYTANEDNISEIFCYDIKEKKTYSTKIDFYPAYIRTDNEGNIYMHTGPKGKVLYVYDKNLAFIKSVDITDEIKALGMENRYIYDMCVSDKGDVYFAISEKYVWASILKLESNGKLKNITGDITDFDEEMTINRCFVDNEGNLVLCSGRSECMVDVISADTGIVQKRYEIFLYGELLGPTKDYDMVYTSDGEVFGYNYMEDNSECIISREFLPGMVDNYEYGNISGEKLYITLSSPKLPKICKLDTSTGETEVYETCANNIMFADIHKDGTLYYVTSQHKIANDEDYGVYETTNIEIYKLDNDGNSELIACLPQYRQEIYPSGFRVDRNGNLLILYPASEEECSEYISSLIVMNTSGDIIATVSPDTDERFTSIIKDNKQSVYICSNYSEIISEINTDTYEISDKKINIPKNNFICSGNDKYSFYYRNDYAVYGYIQESNTSDEIMNMNDYEYPYEEYPGKLFFSENNIVLSPTQIISCDGKLLSKASEERIAQLNSRKTITIAVSGSADIKENVSKFNFENDEYRIVVKDYSKFYEDGKYDDYLTFGKDSENLTKDIIEGDIPDIVMLDNLELPPNLIGTLFTDHKKFIENDPDVNISEFSESFTDEFTYKGKLWTIPVFYTSNTLFGAYENESWSYQDLINYENYSQPVYEFFSSSYYSVFSTLFLSFAHDYIDFESGSCNFDNDEFIRLLEFIKANSSFEDSYQEQSEYLLITENIMNYSDFYRMVSGQMTPHLCGFPSKDGGRNYIFPQLIFSITENSENKEVAWEFIKMFFETKQSYPSIPVLKSEQEAGISEIISHFPEYADENIIKAYKEYIDMPVMSNIMYRRIESIAVECTNGFFNGDVSAEETARDLQNRVSLYLSELT